jgi:glutamate racemase
VQTISKEKPIGVFDSGVGGLTVMKEIIRRLPGESILYLGDTARVPYGIRSPETVSRYSHESARFLISKDIKMLVVACNTSSSVSLGFLKREFNVPVIGVVEPGAKAAAAKTKFRKVSIIGTEATIKSGSYEMAIKEIDSSIKVTGIPCPLFVPLIEEGWLDGEVVTLTAEKYLSGIRSGGVDVLVLGCTHYPMIKDVIAGVTGIPLIDSAVETAREVERVLGGVNMLFKEDRTPLREFYVTDSPEKFADISENFLGYEATNISKIKLGG